MKIVKYKGWDIAPGKGVDTWLCGCLGALCTTLPSFVLMPLWYLFSAKYTIVDDDGNVDSASCFFATFLPGMFFWVLVLIANS